MTLTTITLVCSRNGPSISSRYAGRIYSHICALARTLLVKSTYRRKLQGHFHLLVQAMQSLLTCLFSPLRRTRNIDSQALLALPPWLSPDQPLVAIHAAAFTRLVLSICDPTISSVALKARDGKTHKSLTSETEKARKIAGRHMQYLLTLYIKGQLEMSMLPEVREKLIPGIYAIFDTMDKDRRRALGEGLDVSGRAVLSGMIRDWARFGKWSGS